MSSKAPSRLRPLCRVAPLQQLSLNPKDQVSSCVEIIRRFRTYSCGSDSVHSASSSSFVDVPIGPESPVTIMDVEARFANNENELREIRTAVDQLTQQLDQFLKHFGTTVLASNSSPTSPQLPASAITTPAPTSWLKLATPSDFDGDCKRGHAFLNSCGLFYALCLSDFMNDQAHVLWTLSLMMTGRANSFAEQTLHWEAKRSP